MRKFSQLLVVILLITKVTLAQPNTFPSSGNVGIGTTSPAQRLTIDVGASNGGIQLESTGGQNIIRFRHTNAGLNIKTMQQGIYNGKGFISAVNDALNAETYRFFTFDLSNGNVGIRTPHPSHNGLTINGSVGIQAAGIDKYHMDYYNGGLSFTECGQADYRLFIKDGGNVGIGTQNPQAKLHVEGDIWMLKTGSQAGVQFHSGINNSSLQFIKYGTKHAGVVYNGRQLIFKGMSTGPDHDPDQTLNNAETVETIFLGNVGVGTTTPESPWSRVLQIYDQNNAALSIKTPVKDWQIGTDASGSLWFVDNTTGGRPNRFTIHSNGNVGIGIANPQAKLAVNGDISSKKVKVTQTGWPDYVFASTYKLPTLKEVEAFIKANKHLPDVPSAKEVETNGLDLGDNQTVLLQKIEELTLYAIEADKKNNQLELKALQQEIFIQKLEERLKKLEEKIK